MDFDRTPEEPGHEWTSAFVEDGAPTHLLHVEPGRAVVYDRRLVHFSTANDADDERIAVNSGISSRTRPAPAHDCSKMMLPGMHHRRLADRPRSERRRAGGRGGGDVGGRGSAGGRAPAEDPAATASVGRSGGWRRLFGRR